MRKAVIAHAYLLASAPAFAQQPQRNQQHQGGPSERQGYTKLWLSGALFAGGFTMVMVQAGNSGNEGGTSKGALVGGVGLMAGGGSGKALRSCCAVKAAVAGAVTAAWTIR